MPPIAKVRQGNRTDIYRSGAVHLFTMRVTDMIDACTFSCTV
nr:MAG TPA: hypothetical protein [Caudoviricetes sp.]